MNTLTVQIIEIVTFLLIFLAGMVVASVICFFIWKATVALREALSTINSAAASLAGAIEKLTFIQERTAKDVQSIQDLPKHVLAYAKMAAALVKEIQKFRQSVDEFRAVVLRADGKKMQSLILPDEDEANTVFEIQSLLANDPSMTEDEARMKVEEANQRDMQLSLD